LVALQVRFIVKRNQQKQIELEAKDSVTKLRSKVRQYHRLDD